MKRPTRRTILKMLLLLAAGAAVNVAVAWGLAMAPPAYGPYKRVVTNFVVQDSHLLRFHCREQAGWAEILWQLFDDHPTDAAYISRVRDGHVAIDQLSYEGLGTVVVDDPYRWLPSPLDESGTVLECRKADAYGWPCLSMMHWQTHVDPNFVPSLHLRRGWYLGSRWGDRVLPLHWIWPGFAVNTLFYAAVLWVLFAAPSALRRTIRRRRGQCPACAYPVGESPICTECGAELGKRQSAMGNGDRVPTR